MKNHILLLLYIVLLFFLHFGFQINGINTRYLETILLLISCICVSSALIRLPMLKNSVYQKLLNSTIIYNIIVINEIIFFRKEILIMENEINTQNKIFGKTFFWMFLGLLGSGIIAWYTYTSGLYMNFFTNSSMLILLIIELVAVLLFTFLFKKLPPVAVRNSVFCLFHDKWSNFISSLCCI